MRVVGWGGAVGGHSESRRDTGGVERAAFERPLRRLSAQRRLTHRAVSDPRAGDAAARQAAIARRSKGPRCPWDGRASLCRIETHRSAGRLNATPETSVGTAVTTAQEIPRAAVRAGRSRRRASPSHRARAAPWRNRHRATARTDCRRRSPPRAPPVRRPRARPDAESQFALGQNRGHGHAGAKLNAARRDCNMQQARIGRAHDRLDRRVGLVDRAHDQRAAAEKARAALARQRAGRVGQTGECFDA